MVNMETHEEIKERISSFEEVEAKFNAEFDVFREYVQSILDNNPSAEILEWLCYGGLPNSLDAEFGNKIHCLHLKNSINERSQRNN